MLTIRARLRRMIDAATSGAAEAWRTSICPSPFLVNLQMPGRSVGVLTIGAFSRSDELQEADWIRGRHPVISFPARAGIMRFVTSVTDDRALGFLHIPHARASLERRMQHQAPPWLQSAMATALEEGDAFVDIEFFAHEARDGPMAWIRLARI